MPQARSTLMDPPIEELLDKVDSKFTLVALGAARARQVNAYYNSLGEGLGRVVPPQVTSVSSNPLSIAFQEVAAGKAVYTRPDPDAAVEEGAEGAEGEETPDALASGSLDAVAVIESPPGGGRTRRGLIPDGRRRSAADGGCLGPARDEVPDMVLGTVWPPRSLRAIRVKGAKTS